MAENVRNIIDEIFADSDSDGEETFEGFDFDLLKLRKIKII